VVFSAFSWVVLSEHVLAGEKLLLFDAWETMSLQASKNMYHL
jgi:hypothetical protein